MRSAPRRVCERHAERRRAARHDASQRVRCAAPALSAQIVLPGASVVVELTLSGFVP